jgi:hypothetical protein
MNPSDDGLAPIIAFIDLDELSIDPRLAGRFLPQHGTKPPLVHRRHPDPPSLDLTSVNHVRHMHKDPDLKKSFSRHLAACGVGLTKRGVVQQHLSFLVLTPETAGKSGNKERQERQGRQG